MTSFGRFMAGQTLERLFTLQAGVALQAEASQPLRDSD
jgi:hypothetical protein